jgi:hypothetical protein
MIGIFLRNRDNEICFVQVSKDEDIAAFHYTADPRIMTVMLETGEEETITSEIAPEIHEALVGQDQVLVALLDDTGELEREYWAEMTKG